MITLENIYAIFAILSLAGGFLILLTDNVLYAAIGLLISLLAISGIFVISMADFLAVTQIMIYVGGTLTLMIFGIMLSQRSDLLKNATSKPSILILSIIACLTISISLSWLTTKVNWLKIGSTPITDLKTTTQSIGKSILTEHLLPFEIIAVTLLIALIGAAYVASKALKNR